MKSLVAASLIAAAVSTAGALNDEPRPSKEEWDAKQADDAAAAKAASDKEGKMAAVNKVVKLLEGLQATVEGEGEKEAKTYNKFACFCKDTMAEKTDSIQKGTDEVATLSTTVDELGGKREDLDSKIEDLLKDIEKAEGLIKDENEKSAERVKKYKADAADLSGAIDAIGAATQIIKSSGGMASLAQMKQVGKTLRDATMMADAMGYDVASLQKAASMFLQQAPDVPMEDYKSHSGGVIETLESLLKDFRTQKVELDKEEMSSRHDAETEVQEQTSIAKEKNRLLERAKQHKEQTAADIAMNSQKRTTVAATLLDDQKYLSELATMCQDKAKTWDQRSKVRADELSAIVSATAIIKDTVGEKTAASTIRLAQQGVAVRLAESVAKQPSLMEAIEADAESADAGLSFLQRVQSKAFLAPVAKNGPIEALLWSKGEQMKSTLLTGLATKIKALEPTPDHFAKIKVLIEELINRLQAEAAGEAKQKGWCVKATSEAENKRDGAAATIKELNGQMAQLEVQRDKLTEETKALMDAIDALKKNKEEAIELRDTEKTENEETVKVANEGLDAVKEAIDILKTFYDEAAKAEVTLLQKRGPGDDAPDAGFDGAYTGSGDAAGGVLGMLDVIKSDFERTVTETEKAEHDADQDHQVFLKETDTSITEHEEAHKEKDTQLTDTESTLEGANESLTSETETLNDSIKELLELHGTCVDTAMSYEERVARREDEISALKNALCILSNQAAYGPQAAGMENC